MAFEMVTVTLVMANTYDSGTVMTREDDARVPMPDSLTDEETLNEWAMEHLMPFTGTGRSGDALYEIEIVHSSESALIGMTFEAQG
jgi:hypothetical protein